MLRGHATLAGNPPTLHARPPAKVSVHVEVTRRRHTGSGSRKVRIGLADASLATGDSIAGDGRRGVTEEAAAGAPGDDFSEFYLMTRTDDYLGQPPTSATAPISRPAHAACAVPPWTGCSPCWRPEAGLSVVKAYDPAATGLLTQGRALWLRHRRCRGRAGGTRVRRRLRLRPDRSRAARNRPGGRWPGEQIAVTGPTEVQVGQSRSVNAEPAAQPSAVCFSADGSRAYVAARGQRVTSFTLTASPASAFPQLTLDRSVPLRPRRGPSPSLAARSTWHMSCPAPSPSSTPPRWRLPAHRHRPQRAVLVADGNRVFVGCIGDNTLRAIDIATHQQVGTLCLPARRWPSPRCRAGPRSTW